MTCLATHKGTWLRLLFACGLLGVACGDSENSSDSFATRDTSLEPSHHRSARERCDNVRPRGSFSSSPIEVGPGDCVSDADCSDGPNGRCDFDSGAARCTYDACFSDAECDSGPCSCGVKGAPNLCLGGNCQVDAQCGKGSYCSPSLGSCGNYSGVVAYWCRTPEDTCVEDSECVNPEVGGGYCAYYPEVGHWACQYNHCVG
jgi:hypothetical protein